MSKYGRRCGKEEKVKRQAGARMKRTELQNAKERKRENERERGREEQFHIIHAGR